MKKFTHDNELDVAIDKGIRKLIIPLLIACIALGYATAAFLFWLAVVVLNHFLMAVL